MASSSSVASSGSSGAHRLNVSSSSSSGPGSSSSSRPEQPNAVAAGPWMGQNFLFKDASFIKYIEGYDYRNCDDVSKYEKVAKIGQGTFGYGENQNFFRLF